MTPERFSGRGLRGAVRSAELGTGGDPRRGPAQMAAWKRTRMQGENGSFPASNVDPKPPPLLVLYPDLVDPDEIGPEKVYGQYPRALIRKLLPWLRCERHDMPMRAVTIYERDGAQLALPGGD